MSVTIRGLISASEASESRKNRTNALRNFSPFLALSPFRPRAWQTLRAWKSSRPAPTSIGSRWIFSGVSWATISMSTPALGRRHQDRALQAAVDGQAEVELPGDVVADGDQHLLDHLPLGAGLVGDQGLAEQLGGGPLRVLLRPDELDALGHALLAGLQAAGDLQGLAPVVVGADGDPLAPAAGVDLRLDDDQAAAELVEGLGRLVGRGRRRSPRGRRPRRP